jgi:hypothetical protein
MPSVLFVLIAILFVSLGVLRFSKARRLVRQWAESGGLRIVSMQWEPFPSGPFALAAFGKQIVYALSVVDGAGRLRQCWAKCGNWWFGLLDDSIEVVWSPDVAKESLGGRRF